jgi:hypothetical protein
MRIDLGAQRGDRRAGPGQRGVVGSDRQHDLEQRLPLLALQDALTDSDFGQGHLAPQRPRAGALGQLLDLDAEFEAGGAAGLVPQRDADLVGAFRQHTVRHQGEKAAAERVAPPRKGGPDVEAPHTISGGRHRRTVDRNLDGGDAGPGQGPAGDFEIAPHRQLHRTANHGRRIELEFAIGVADGVAAVDAARLRRVAAGASGHRDLADLAIVAPHPQCDLVCTAQRPAGVIGEDKP